jgi:hypothetical protein
MVRFQADADLNQIILAAAVRRAPGIDFRSASLADLHGLDDLAVLTLAARDERILVTHDSKTMPRHFGEFVNTHRSAGVIVIPQHLPAVQAVDELLLIWTATSPEDWINRICYLPL